MKLTKEQLKRIIKEELETVGEWVNRGERGDYIDIAQGIRDANRGSEEEEELTDPVLEELKKLLAKWPDKRHPYYKDIQNIVDSWVVLPDEE